MTLEALAAIAARNAAIAKLLAAAKAADDADHHKNSVHAKTGNSLAYWEAARISEELSGTFKDLATPEIILTFSDALAEAESVNSEFSWEYAAQIAERFGVNESDRRKFGNEMAEVFRAMVRP